MLYKANLRNFWAKSIALYCKSRKNACFVTQFFRFLTQYFENLEPFIAQYFKFFLYYYQKDPFLMPHLFRIKNHLNFLQKGSGSLVFTNFWKISIAATPWRFWTLRLAPYWYADVMTFHKLLRFLLMCWHNYSQNFRWTVIESDLRTREILQIAINKLFQSSKPRDSLSGAWTFYPWDKLSGGTISPWDKVSGGQFIPRTPLRTHFVKNALKKWPFCGQCCNFSSQNFDNFKSLRLRKFPSSIPPMGFGTCRAWAISYGTP